MLLLHACLFYVLTLSELITQSAHALRLLLQFLYETFLMTYDCEASCLGPTSFFTH